ncbi:SLC13 family permease [Magnetospirillum sp. UT-4]|uniref:SLC13 family permease n=1 Tax=Magnetospirillum sp. UT-4 TaxID=2681467 RepID=UPI001571E341|nr:SLC13 family permease [Magnetospirillum sp. UT-4]
MTAEMLATFALLAGVMGFLIWDRFRYDIVAGTALVVGVAIGVVPVKEAFTGFSDDIVILVASALVVSAGIERSGLVDLLLGRISGRLDSVTRQVVVLGSAVAILSAVMKNVGALAIFLPVAIQLARRHGTPPSRLLMPLAFASLLGGICTLIGTSPNIIVSRMREEMLGTPFGMFSFTPLGLALTVLGVAFLSVGWRLLPRGRGGGAGQPFMVDDYTSEMLLPTASPFVNKTVEALEEAGEGDVTICAVIRDGGRRYIPAGHWWLFGGDVLVLRCDATALKRLVMRAKLEVPGATEIPQAASGNEVAVAEAVVTEGSALINATARDLRLRDHFGLNLVALSRRGRPVRQRIRDTRMRRGDLLVFQGHAEDMPTLLGVLGCLPLAERRIDLDRPAHAWRAVAILGVAIALSTSGVIPVAAAFFAAAVAMVATGALKLTDAYDRVEWPILVLIGCLIPIGEALQRTGGSGLIAAALADSVQGLPPLGAVAAILLAAMAVTPFLNNTATVLVLAPIAASLARQVEANPDPFLMAVAVGAACDFLTPVGHQCNTLVMGPGGYRFSDYWHLGLPLSVMVAVLAPPLIVLLWPP